MARSTPSFAARLGRWSLALAATGLVIAVCSPSAHGETGLEYFAYGAIADDPSTTSFYVSSYAAQSDHEEMLAGYGAGFSWYSTMWALTDRPVANAQVGLASTWIQPNLVGIANPDCTYRKYEPIVQTIEGSLGWWNDTPFRTAMPKYEPGITQNCWSTGAREFWAGQPIGKNEGGWITLSNQILLPPDGMSFTPSSSGKQLGQGWFSLPFPETGSRSGIPSGQQAWTLFLNATNFRGPLAYVAPQYWAASRVGIAKYDGLTLDTRPGSAYGVSSEWAALPRIELTDRAGHRYSKIPQLQFPADADGRTVVARDFTGYSTAAIADRFAAAATGNRALPTSIDPTGVKDFPLLPEKPSTIYQNGSALPDISANFSLTSFDEGRAIGFQWSRANTTIRWPSYFRQQGSTRIAVSASAVPARLRDASFAPDPSVRSKVYQTPTWFNEAPMASGPRTTRLNDGSMVTYRWVRFVDQPLLQRFNYTAPERQRLQRLAVRIQREWASTPLMAAPSGGTLATFDKGLLVTPPKGMEFGYVPIVIRQEATPR